MTTATPNRIDAAPVRQHIRDLHAAGFTNWWIARLAGVATETVIGFTSPISRPGNRKGVKRTCHPQVAAKILAVRAEEELPGLVDTTATRRRIQALIAAGWPVEQIARRINTSGNHLRFAVARPHVYGRTAKAVADVYEQLKGRRPESNGVAKVEASKARKRAAANRWPTPKYWADRMDAIDDPDFEPMYGVTRRLIIAQDANWIMTTTGASKNGAADRIGVSLAYVEHAFRDHPEYAVEVAA